MQLTYRSQKISQLALRRQVVIAGIFAVSLVAFEIFNFDTTQFALQSLLGATRFGNVEWASILAIAFCAIDFAGLARFFTPNQDMRDEPKEFWFLMGAWFLGATMNATMTWWAISLTLINHNLGNEILSRGQLLRFVPIFVAVLVWLTRVLFIGGLAIMGEKMLMPAKKRRKSAAATRKKSPSRKTSRSKTNQRPKKSPSKTSAPYKPATRRQPVTAKSAIHRTTHSKSIFDEEELEYEDDWWAADDVPVYRSSPPPNSKSTLKPIAKPKPIRTATYKPKPIATKPARKTANSRRNSGKKPNETRRPPMPPMRNTGVR